MKNFCILIIILSQFGDSFGSTWELYQVFSNKNNSELKSFPTSKIPLVFTYNSNDISDLTTAKGRTLHVNKKERKKEEIPRFTSGGPLNFHGSSSKISELPNEPLPWMVKSLLKYVTIDQARYNLGKLRKNLIEMAFDELLLSPSSTSSTAISSRNGGWGGIGFPSLEGALLSLAFLTFAVFLIDLIQTLLSRLRVSTPILASTGPAITAAGISATGGAGRMMPKEDSKTFSSLTNLVWEAIDRSF